MIRRLSIARHLTHSMARGLLAVIGTVVVLATAWAQDGGYKPARQDGGVAPVQAPASTNFVLALGGEAVRQVDAGLLWQRRVQFVFADWSEAKSYCGTLNLGGLGWRLPSEDELQTVVDAIYSPTVPPTVFGMSETGPFWTNARTIVKQTYASFESMTHEAAESAYLDRTGRRLRDGEDPVFGFARCVKGTPHHRDASAGSRGKPARK